MTNHRKKTGPVMKTALTGAAVLVLLFAITVGVMLWRQKAQYPPPVGHFPEGRYLEFTGDPAARGGLRFTLPVYTDALPEDGTLYYGIGSADAGTGLTVTPDSPGFSNFLEVLKDNGYAFSDITLFIPEHTVRSRSPESLNPEDGLVTLQYESESPVSLRIAGQDCIAFPGGVLSLTFDYSAYPDSVVFYGQSDVTWPLNHSDASDGPVKLLADAFFMDAAGARLQLVFMESGWASPETSGTRRARLPGARLDLID